MAPFSHLKTFFTHRQSLAVASAFLLLGLLFGSWATMIPSIKLKFNLNDGELGLVLLSLPVGAMLFNPFSARLIQRFGMKHMTFYGMLLLSIVYTLPVAVPQIWIAIISLIFTGIGITMVNVAMNTCASGIESHYRISVMSTQHGLFSVGLMIGSFASSIALGVGLQAPLIMKMVAMIGVLLAFVARKDIYQIPEEKVDNDVPKFKLSWPKGSLLLMVIISLCINMTEGAMADWTAIYMDEIVHSPTAFIGYGFAGYSMFMALGRFLGDGLIPRLGGNKVLYYGSILVILGMVTALALPHLWSSTIGFALVGLGVSCGAPILYGNASRTPGMSKGEGLATLNTFAMAGFMVGPVILGFISSASSLPFALCIIIGLAVVWLFFSKIVVLD